MFLESFHKIRPTRSERTGDNRGRSSEEFLEEFLVPNRGASVREGKMECVRSGTGSWVRLRGWKEDSD